MMASEDDAEDADDDEASVIRNASVAGEDQK
jgi:hypothetical protein